MMATTPQGEEPGFESDVDELPKDRDNGSPNTLEEDPDTAKADEEDANLEAQKDAAEERKEGGYQ
jgi:hypothetical protein